MNYTKGEWKWQFDPLDPKGMVEVTQNGEVIFRTQTLKNAQRLCQALNSWQDMYEALIQAMRTFQAHGIKETDPRYLKLRQAVAKAEGK